MLISRLEKGSIPLRGTMDNITQFFAGLDKYGMGLWTGGYLVGLTTGLLFSPALALLITLGLLGIFTVVRAASARKHGPVLTIRVALDTIKDTNTRV